MNIVERILFKTTGWIIYGRIVYCKEIQDWIQWGYIMYSIMIIVMDISVELKLIRYCIVWTCIVRIKTKVVKILFSSTSRKRRENPLTNLPQLMFSQSTEPAPDDCKPSGAEVCFLHVHVHATVWRRWYPDKTHNHKIVFAAFSLHRSDITQCMHIVTTGCKRHTNYVFIIQDRTS